MDDLQINSRLVIPARDLRMETSTATGPGGQHVNRARTRVSLVLDVGGSEALGEARRRTLQARLGHRIARDGTLRVTCGRHRSQADNLHEVRRRLSNLLCEALKPVRIRKPTRPTAASRRRRKEAKQRRGATKQDRQQDWSSDG